MLRAIMGGIFGTTSLCLMCAVLLQGGFCPAAAQDVGENEKVYFPMKDLLAKGFEANVEINMQGSGMSVTTFMEEYHDLTGQKGRVDSEDNNFSFYYFTDRKQLAVITGPRCWVQNLDKSGFPLINTFWGWTGTNSVMGPSAILFRDTTEMPKWIRQKTVRGIVCEEFTATDKIDPGITVTYCFTESKWSGPDGFQRVPIEASARGTAGLKGVDTLVDNTYQFTYFHADIKTHLNLMIPRGIGCSGLNITGQKSLPKLHPQYSFFTENYLMTDDSNGIYLYKIWYDSLNKLTKIIGTYREEPFTLIQDFNTGVSYHFDNYDRCSIESIRDSQFEKTFAGLVGALKTPLEFLALDGNYYYVGQDTERGVYCDIWEKVLFNVSYIEKTPNKIVYTYYFGTSEIVSVTNGDRNVQVPVALHVSLYISDDTLTSPVVSEYNFFRFDEPLARTFFDVMNIENCFFEETQKNFFTLSFESTPDNIKLAKENHRLFELETTIAIQNSARVSPLRIPHIKVYYETTQILVQGGILERPPILAGFFIPDPDKFPPTSGDSQQETVQAEEDCAQKCLLAQECAGATVCKIAGKKEMDCYLTNNDGTKEWKNPIVDRVCKLYMKSVGGEIVTDAPLTLAMGLLEQDGKAGKIQVTLDPKDKDRIIFQSKDVDINSKPFSFEDSERFESLLQDFQLDFSSQTTKQVPDGLISPRECYEQCLKEESMDCASFSFCKNTKSCRISSIYLSKDNKDEVETATNCKVYRKEALKFFTEFPGKVSKFRGPKELSNINSPADCAFACKNEKDISCRGFQFCQKTRDCILSTLHVLDTGDLVDANPTCSFFSMKYSVEFGTLGRDTIDDNNAAWLEANTFEECAKTCMEWQTFECKSINYCPSSGDQAPLCGINTKSILDSDVVTVVSDTCQSYIKLTKQRQAQKAEESKETQPKGNKVVKRQVEWDLTGIRKKDDMLLGVPNLQHLSMQRQAQKAEENKDVTKDEKKEVKRIKDEGVNGVSKSSFAATLTCLLLVGILVGAGGFLLFNRYKAKRQGDTSVRFINQ